jgi:hypothetical protein
MCNICQNGWRITRGTQLEKRVLRLKSRCYNKSDLVSKLMTSLSPMEVFPCFFKSLLDLPK